MKYLLAILVTCTAHLANAQGWTWMHGDSVANTLAVYGARGVASPGNSPGGRMAGSSWTDNAGNFWLFGGFGNTSGGGGYMNDLWKYNIVTGQWAWMNGSQGIYASSVFGSKGISAAGNTPGARNGSAQWTDKFGDLWLFGGDAGSYYMNDLWRYNIAANEWTWMAGDSVGNLPADYGVRGIAAASNKPGGRVHAGCWKDAKGNFWVFGGSGGDPSQPQNYSGWFNDLWQYNPATNLWTWVSGDKLANQTGSYGAKGTPSILNKPGSREPAAAWADTAGDFWIMGGLTYKLAGEDKRNDLWRFNPTAGMWTWMAGDSTAYSWGFYGTNRVASASNTPPARKGAAFWTDKSNTLWLYGGEGPSNFPFDRYLGDLWKYDIKWNQWTWVDGDTVRTIGEYGTKGITDPANKPFGRWNPFYWNDASGNLWLFGGIGYASNTSTFNQHGYKNDLWKLSASTLGVRSTANSQKATFTISPIPAKDQCYIRGLMPPTASKDAEAVFILSDAFGKMLRTYSFRVTLGTINGELDLSNLPQGVYYLCLSGHGPQAALKLFVE